MTTSKSITNQEILYVTKVNYAWISHCGITVYVADIEFDEDEEAIIQQIDAIELGWS